MKLNWYRSWPSANDLTKFDGRSLPAHVVDTLPRLVISGYNYEGTDWPADTPGFCMLEWDVALDPTARQAFAAEALIHPRELLVASYAFHDTECMWVGDDNEGGGPSTGGRPVTTYDDRTHSFGLGCIYFPQVVLQEFLDRATHEPGGFTDYTFGHWYFTRYGPPRLTWRVRPQHLHEYEEHHAG